MTRRNFMSFAVASLLFGNIQLNAFDSKNAKYKSFELSINGDLDDDLIVLKSTPLKTIITDIHQMHNPSGIFQYGGDTYRIEHIPGYISFEKRYDIAQDEIYIVCLANEREEANLSTRIRTHYKNEKLLFNNNIFLKALMPEYDSVPNYPLWFGKDEVPAIGKKDINDETYNYYRLFDNTTVQCGIILPYSSEIEIYLYDQNNTLKHTFKEQVDTVPKYLKSNELKSGNFNTHDFTEIDNILNETNDQIENNNIIKTMLIKFNNNFYIINLPYPIMYPNLICGVSNV